MSLKNKVLIFNSDDFGHSHPFNMGIYKGIKSNVIKTSCVLSNTEGYMEAVSLKSDFFSDINFGIHLNIVEGKSITGKSILCDSKNVFNNGYIDILRKSYDRAFLSAIEFEFRAQIERVLSDFKVNHINSHVHIHSIPNIFNLVLNLALEYKIDYIRTQYEKPYISGGIKKNFCIRYPINLVKRTLLNYLTKKNKLNIKDKINTNDYIIGVTYTGFMDKNTVLDGLKKIDEGIAEILVHPAYYEKEILKPDNYREYLLTQD